jgi:cytochrome b pre-mRNA-processing protein 3
MYQGALAQSRRVEFYTRLGVADTMDGRFDLLCLHAAILIARLSREGAEGRAMAQALFDVLFTQVDYALREIGIGDLGVPKHMQKMMKAFNGRMQAYAAAFQSGDEASLAQAIARNLYRREAVEDAPAAAPMARYALWAISQAAATPMEDVTKGMFEYPEPPPLPLPEERNLSHA